MRINQKNRIIYISFFKYIAFLCFLWGGLYLLPVLMCFFDRSELSYSHYFYIPAGILVVTGLILYLITGRRQYPGISLYSSRVLILIMWMLSILISTVPFMLLAKVPFLLALFESTSGLTTTGLTVVDVKAQTHMLLFWRSLLQFVGGAGFAIIMVTFAGNTSINFAIAESRDEYLVPNIKSSSLIILKLYFTYAIAGIAAYTLFGMGLFDAINHTFAAVSTGGFSTQVNSIGAWNSVPIEIITIVLMIMGGTSFLSAYTLSQGNVKAFLKNSEIKLMFFLVIIGFTAIIVSLGSMFYNSVSKVVRVAVFESVSAITTTGFSTVGYGNWPLSGLFFIIIFMVIGGGTFSTAGGIKQLRVYILIKTIIMHLKRQHLPKRRVLMDFFYNGERRQKIDYEQSRSVAYFTIIYLMLLAIGIIIALFNNFNLETSVFEIASALGTVGLSLGATSASAPKPVLIYQIIAMILGRLEIFVVILGFLQLIKDTRNFMFSGKSASQSYEYPSGPSEQTSKEV
ncbi:MAG: potassium transporter TrkG [bacterium]